MRDEIETPLRPPNHDAWHLIFGSAALVNTVVGLSIVFARGWLKAVLPLDPVEGTNKVTLYLTSGLVILFAVVYARAAIQRRASREMLTLCVFGKIIGAASVLLVVFQGGASLRLLPLAIVDLAYASVFAAYLTTGRKGPGV